MGYGVSQWGIAQIFPQLCEMLHILANVFHSAPLLTHLRQLRPHLTHLHHLSDQRTAQDRLNEATASEMETAQAERPSALAGFQKTCGEVGIYWPPAAKKGSALGSADTYFSERTVAAIVTTAR
jgi:hypothetical protein